MVEKLGAKVLSALAAKGIKARVVPVARLPELQEDIESLHRNGSIDEEVYSTNLTGFSFVPPPSMPNARSIIVAAVPQPTRMVHFTVKGRDVALKVPPTYANAWAAIETVKTSVQHGCHGVDVGLERATLPLKTLAARTGLVKYGRNNITYLGDVGSFHRLVAYFCDHDLELDHWQEREALPTCASCRHCIDACPAHVIDPERFLVHVERCLTFHNEKPSQKQFPRSIDKASHNAVVGCMVCQDVCPHNRSIRTWVEEGDHFNKDETTYLLEGDFEGEEAKEMEAKLERNGLELALFPRNLRVLLDIR